MIEQGAEPFAGIRPGDGPARPVMLFGKLREYLIEPGVDPIKIIRDESAKDQKAKRFKKGPLLSCQCHRGTSLRQYRCHQVAHSMLGSPPKIE